MLVHSSPGKTTPGTVCCCLATYLQNESRQEHARTAESIAVKPVGLEQVAIENADVQAHFLSQLRIAHAVAC